MGCDGRQLEIWTPLKGPTHRLIHSQALTLGSRDGQQLGRCQRHTGKECIVWFQGKGWKDGWHCPSVESSSGAAYK